MRDLMKQTRKTQQDICTAGGVLTCVPSYESHTVITIRDFLEPRLELLTDPLAETDRYSERIHDALHKAEFAGKAITQAVIQPLHPT